MSSVHFADPATSPAAPDDVLGALRRAQLEASLVALFGSAEPGVTDDLLRLGEWVRVAGGELLFREGDAGDSMCIVVAGRLVAVCDDPSGGRRVVGHVHPGESVGEMGLLAGQPRTATVLASRDTVVLRISDGAFRELVARHPHIVAGAARLIVRRTSELIHRRATVERVKRIAIVPLRRSVPTADFVERLRRALARSGSTTVIDRARAEAVLAASGVPADGSEARNFVLGTWLDDEELRYDSLVFEAGALGDPWTERCVREADLVLAVAPFGDSPDLQHHERRLADGNGAGQRRELVLLHPPRAPAPADTARWLAGRPFTRHHHVRCDRDDDFRRLARFVSGRAVGVVLGGGGARGFAHLGVIRALREARIPIDAVGGTSQGAVVAAAVAMEWDDDTIEEVHRRFTARNPIGDYALFPHLALVKGRRLDAALQHAFGDAAIEDLWRPFLCVSSDLTLATVAVHRRGPLWRALRASVSIPGILPPVVIDGHLHVDGALLDNLPVDAMRESGVGRVIAVDLTVGRELGMSASTLPSTTEFLRERLRSGAEHARLPALGSIIFKSVMMPSVRRARELEREVDLYLAPEPAQIGFLEWSALDRGAGLGHRYARQELARRDLRAWVEEDASPPQAH